MVSRVKSDDASKVRVEKPHQARFNNTQYRVKSLEGRRQVTVQELFPLQGSKVPKICGAIQLETTILTYQALL